MKKNYKEDGMTRLLEKAYQFIVKQKQTRMYKRNAENKRDSQNYPEERSKVNRLAEIKIQQTPEEKACQYMLGLKQDGIYKQKAKNLFLGIYDYMQNEYSGIKIDTPKMREKSPKSGKGKIKRLEIERLAKLYAIEGISLEEEQEFIQIIRELSKQDEVEDIVENVEDLLQRDMEQIDIQKIVENIVQHKMNAHSKTALLRILKTRIENSNLENKQEWLENLETEYGENAAIKYDDPERNLLRTENMEEIKQNPEEIARIHNPEEYLKVKDIVAMRFVFVDFPEDYISDSKIVNVYLEKARNTKTKEEESFWKDKALIEFEKEFARNLLDNTELLQNLGFEPMPNAYKHKNKANGYVADHIKLRSIDNPEYIVEVQFRTIYREELAKNGEAAHDQRPGKARKKPELQNKSQKAFIEEIKNTVPKYTIIREGKLYDCNMLQNTMAYFQDYIDLEDKEDLKMLQAIEEERCIV
ncbi:MAG: hypothetical protein ACLTEH_03420 [Clostridia bacterium]